MHITFSLESEVERQIERLRHSNTNMILLSISAPQLSAAALNDAVCAAAGHSDIVGSLQDGAVGVLSLLPMRAGAAVIYEQRFISRLRVCLQQPGGGRAWMRSARRWTAELSSAAELFEALANAPCTCIIPGLPGPVAATMDEDALLMSSKHWFNLHAYVSASEH